MLLKIVIVTTLVYFRVLQLQVLLSNLVEKWRILGIQKVVQTATYLGLYHIRYKMNIFLFRY